jgi:hypothetical protein
VLYGAAEFSRDTDFAVLASPANIDRLRTALDALEAVVIAVPPFEVDYLERGHAVHFRCGHPEAAGLRVDIMARLRGVDPFEALWARRISLSLHDDVEVDVLSLPDLVSSKKTQRDKDWPMLRRLMEVSYDSGYSVSTPELAEFWLTELRTPELLLECATRFSDAARRIEHRRPAIGAALENDGETVATRLAEEEVRERAADRIYWAPLRAELQVLRRQRGPSS